ncbi:MAG: hypothetical protein V7691_14985 [Galbibacter orientalis]|uniref:hypothetical protein n=1 Tax=Galbibacter orientalis TaxID=453852 RepID=UPI00300148F2
MNNDKSYFYKLLIHYDSKGYFQNGLTLPFMIGSRIFLEPKNNLNTVNEVITKLNNSAFKINVLKCEGIGEYVFRICDSGDNKIYRNLENFVITDYSFSGYSNINQVIKELEHKYNHLLEDKKYSKINGKWQFFCEKEDIPKINEIE